MSFTFEGHGLNEDEVKAVDKFEYDPSDGPDPAAVDMGWFVRKNVDIHNPPDLEIVDGVPRYAHKTTYICKEADKSGTTTIHFVGNHELGRGTAKGKLVDRWNPANDEYGVNNNDVVHVKGKKRACNGCDDCTGGQPNFGKIMSAAEEEMSKPGYVDPSDFSEDVCGYWGAIYACQYADHIVTVPQMWPRIRNHVDRWNVAIDEEDTMRKWTPNSAEILRLDSVNEDIINSGLQPEYWNIGNYGLPDRALDNLQDRVQRDINELDRVPSRYRYLDNAIDKLRELTNVLAETVTEARTYNDPEAIAELFRDIEISEIEKDGPKGELDGALKLLRNEYHRFYAAQAVEPLLNEPRVTVQQSRGELLIRLVSNPVCGYIRHREIFSEAENVWLVGNRYAKYFASHFHPDPNDCYNDRTGDITKDELEILKVEGEDEFERRSRMTDISKRVSDGGDPALLIAGSKTRAKEAWDGTPGMRFFKDGETVKDIEDQINGAENGMVLYMGSRATRGLDTPNRVTVVRSEHFAAPMWDYFRPGEKVHGVDIRPVAHKMHQYENRIEVHNAMLRGAGQGEKHVAIIPSEVDLFWNLDHLVSTRDYMEIEDIIAFIRQARDLNWDGHKCHGCNWKFGSYEDYRGHDCDERMNRR